MKTTWITLTLLVAMSCSSIALAQQPNQQRRLGILGGLGGAAIGAAIGEDDGDAVPGALIGGAIGMISGAAVGNSIDQDQQRARAFQAAVAQQRAQAVTMGDVVSMTQAGLSDAVIINHIQTHGVAQRLTANDLIVLKQQGVRDPVLAAMQSIPQPQPVVVRQPAPVVVEEHYYTPAPWPYPRYHRHYRPAPRSHSSFHFSFGH